MRRIFADYAYSTAPRTACWWDETIEIPARAPFAGSARIDVAIIGAGFTGLSAALHLARAGVSVCVFDAEGIGWGGSGRNGGFCCLGGGMASDYRLDRRFGRIGRVAFHRAELAATVLVEKLIESHGLDVDRHSRGETCLAHRSRDLEDLRKSAARLSENYGVEHEILDAAALRQQGMGGPFHGGLTIRAGFGLNPRKFIAGIAGLAETAGAHLYDRSAVTTIERHGTRWQLRVNDGRVDAERVIIATNGYSSDDLPDWLSARYLPSQSNVIVTRPLSAQELSTQGWTSDQMAYDSRHLLHYFRLLPDRRFLFGMRGGIFTGARAERRAQARIRGDFEAMFPAWRHVPTRHGWSGMVSIARDRLPFVGEVPGQPGLLAGLCYHGNGVAMGTYGGAILAALARDRTPEQIYPEAIQRPLRKFPLGRYRRALIPIAYAGYALADR